MIIIIKISKDLSVPEQIVDWHRPYKSAGLSTH